MAKEKIFLNHSVGTAALGGENLGQFLGCSAPGFHLKLETKNLEL
jgi:hypothetical protein